MSGSVLNAGYTLANKRKAVPALMEFRTSGGDRQQPSQQINIIMTPFVLRRKGSWGRVRTGVDVTGFPGRLGSHQTSPLPDSLEPNLQLRFSENLPSTHLPGVARANSLPTVTLTEATIYCASDTVPSVFPLFSHFDPPNLYKVGTIISIFKEGSRLGEDKML